MSVCHLVLCSVSASLKFPPQLSLSSTVLAIVQPQLPRGQSYSDFFSANYVSGFPSNEMMGWEFVVPPKHNFTVSFLGHTAPICGTKAVEVRYEQEGKAPVVKSMTEEQPANLQGSFSLLLQNCDSVKKAGSPKLTLNFRVSVLRSGVPRMDTICIFPCYHKLSFSATFQRLGAIKVLLMVNIK